jgi:hypothetical protein
MNMAYRETARSKQARKKWSANAVAAKNRNRLSSDPKDYPAQLPQLRREIIIIDHDFERKEYRMELRKSDRQDCYDVYIDGKLWKPRIGWSRVQESIRKAFPRVRAAQ